MKFRDFLNYDISEAGNSASKVTWRRDDKVEVFKQNFETIKQ